MLYCTSIGFTGLPSTKFAPLLRWKVYVKLSELTLNESARWGKGYDTLTWGIHTSVSKVFTAGRIESLRPRVQAIADALVDGLAGRDHGDLIADFAFPMPIAVICEMLGVPMGDRETFRGWSNVVVSTFASGVDPRAAVESLSGYIVELIAAKRANLGNDLLSFHVQYH